MLMDWANFFMDDTLIHISRPLALLTRGHAKKIDLTPTDFPFTKAIIETAKGRLRIDSSQFSGLSHSSNPEHQSGCSHIHFISLRDVEHLRKTFPHNSS
jgi:hypothetical protein